MKNYLEIWIFKEIMCALFTMPWGQDIWAAIVEDFEETNKEVSSVLCSVIKHAGSS